MQGFCFGSVAGDGDGGKEGWKEGGEDGGKEGRDIEGEGYREEELRRSSSLVESELVIHYSLTPNPPKRGSATKYIRPRVTKTIEHHLPPYTARRFQTTPTLTSRPLNDPNILRLLFASYAIPSYITGHPDAQGILHTHTHKYRVWPPSNRLDEELR